MDVFYVVVFCGVKCNKIVVCVLVYWFYDVNFFVGWLGVRWRIGELKGRLGIVFYGGVFDVKDEKIRFVLVVGF